MTETNLIETTVHGRYLVRAGDPARLLVGFHGYAQSAEIQLAEMEKIEAASGWTLLSIQALNRFYNRYQDIGGCWMTRGNDREEQIADNIRYIHRILGTLPEPELLVFTGFSQGAAMAWRAAATNPANGVIILGGDVPPDATGPLPPALIGRGRDDDWYTDEKLKYDLSFLSGRCEVTTLEFGGGHEWTDDFRAAASNFLRMIARR